MRLENIDLSLPVVRANPYKIFSVVGGLALIIGLFLDAERAWANLLLISFVLVAMGLCGTFFVALQYVSSAGWSIVIRRIAEAMASLIPIGAIGILAVLILHPTIYPWFAESSHNGGHGGGFKDIWLSLPFFIGRTVFYLGLWILMGRAIIKHSREQDEDGSPEHTRKNVRISALFTVLFALTFWLASFDWIMSLEPKWYSTIFGIYNFAGMFTSGLAIMIITAIWLEKGPMRGIITGEHFHDLGKLLFAFCTFWMYIWFCQYMLIWYANIPEEAVYFTGRMVGAWKPLMFLNIFLNWVVPFGVIMSSRTKRNTSIMFRVSLAVLAGRWLDMYLMVFPSSAGDAPAIGFLEAGFVLGAIGLIVLVVSKSLGKASLIPRNDPYLVESMHHHQ